MSDKKLTENEFVVLMIDIHNLAKGIPCTETNADKIKEQVKNIMVDGNTTNVAYFIGFDIARSREDSNRKP